MAKVATSHGKYKGVIVSKTDMRKLKAGLQAKMKDIVALLVKQLSFIGEKTRRINNNAFSGFVIQYVSVNTQRVKFECFNLHLSKRISHLMRFRYSDANIRFSFQLA